MLPCFYYKIGYYIEVRNQCGDPIFNFIFSNKVRKNRYIDRLKEKMSIKYTEDANMILIIDHDDNIKFMIHTKIIYFYTNKFYDDIPENILFYICKDDNGNDTDVIIGADSYENLLIGLVKQKIIDININKEIKDNIINENFDDYLAFEE